MRVTVSSRHTELSEPLRAAAIEKIGRLERFLDGMDRAEVHFSEEKNPRIADREVCEVTIEGFGHYVRCKVAAPDGFAAIDRAVEKLEHQLTRLKSRLRKRKSSATRRLANGAPALGELVEADDEDGPALADDAYVTRQGEEIVRRKSFAIRPLSVDEAVLQLDLLDHAFFFFTNADTGRSAVLYRRHSGGLGLIDASA
ncbi:MAG: ribosome-associated translation inhibitor RaiA [Acidimicrobiia bacterium]|nr:ribosome-associated translation inhibitor RaiA [Acidimicrobiia bacterium]